MPFQKQAQEVAEMMRNMPFLEEEPHTASKICCGNDADQPSRRLCRYKVVLCGKFKKLASREREFIEIVMGGEGGEADEAEKSKG